MRPLLRSQIVLLLLALLALPLAAQVSRDAKIPESASRSAGTLAGVVVAATPNAPPLRRVVVTAAGAGLPAPHSTITDDAGRFVMGGLPAGRFRLTASKPGYLPAAFGATGATHPGAEIVLSADERLANLVVKMVRAAAVGGTVRDRFGQPMERVHVTMFRTKSDGTFAAVGAPSASDDRGIYRVFGLPPGEYVIAASATLLNLGGEVETPSDAQVDAIFQMLVSRRSMSVPQSPRAQQVPEVDRVQLAPVFFPGVLDASQASRVKVQAGDDLAGLDIPWQEERSSSVEGVLVSMPTGLQRISLSMSRITSDVTPGALLTARPDAGGRFRFTGVGPGRLVVEAIGRAAVDGRAESSFWWGRAPVDVVGRDVTGIEVVLRPALRVTGRVAFDGAMPSAAELSRMRVSLKESSFGPASRSAGLTSGSAPTAPLKSDGSFELANVVPGRYSLEITASGWFLSSGTIANQQVVDGPFDVTDDGTPHLSIALSKRLARLVGTLQAPAHQAVSSYSVVIFPGEAKRRSPSSLRVRTSAVASDGTFIIDNLPPGDYLVGIATATDPEDLRDPAFLDQLALFALHVALSLGNTATLTLRIPDST